MADAQPYILVVDDHPDGREMLAEYLEFLGFDVVCATTGEEALTHTQGRRPALILMDLQMPGIGGWEATRQLKADADTRDIIVIALTAHALVPDVKTARQAGCDAVVSKPFDIVALGRAISEVMQRGRAGLAAMKTLTPLQRDATGSRKRSRP